MFGFIKKGFFAVVIFFSFNVLSVNSLKCISMNNQECKARPKIINVNSNEPVFYPYNIKVNKCSGSCNNIINPYIKRFVKSINVKVFNLIQRINQAKQILWYKTCKCVCRLSAAICNSKQIWNDDKCRCECKKDLIDKGICDKGFSWNPSNSECDCFCKNTLIDKLVEECTRVADGDKIYNETLNTISSDECASCTLHVVLFAGLLTANVIIGGAFVYCYWYKRSNDQSRLKSGVKYSGTETMIY